VAFVISFVVSVRILALTLGCIAVRCQATGNGIKALPARVVSR